MKQADCTELELLAMDPGELDNFFSQRSYISGFAYSYGDFALYNKIKDTYPGVYRNKINVSRWFNHIKTCSADSKKSSSQVSVPSNTKTDMPLDQLILDELAVFKEIDSLKFAKDRTLDHQKVVGAIKSLIALPGNYVEVSQQQTSTWELSDEGKLFMANGSYEYSLYNSIPKDGILQKELMKGANAKIGFSKAMSLGWISIDKKHENGPTVFRKVENVSDIVKEALSSVNDKTHVSDKQVQDLKKRKLINPVITKYYLVSKGSGFRTAIEKPEADLTFEMLQDDSWKDKTFKEYNFSAKGAPIASGYLHPLMKVKSEFRRIFLDMGFSEMPTNRFVENGFWNFDALFQPQQHPARDAHDTFFISDPEMTCSSKFPQDYLERVKETHENGGFGSTGYNYDWKINEAQKNILRTHTTAVSARMLYLLAQEKEFKPVKMFSVDRVFRNETLDATHLAEFHQIEGVVADRNLTLGHLIGVLSAFFKKLGLEKLKFKPAYNPYTEPSMEIFSYHPGLKKWVEIGNSGMFRPEMLLPMGIPNDVNVIAWGLSLERPTMIKYGINNIRELIGPKVNLNMIYDNPICRLDKM